MESAKLAGRRQVLAGEGVARGAASTPEYLANTGTWMIFGAFAGDRHELAAKRTPKAVQRSSPRAPRRQISDQRQGTAAGGYDAGNSATRPAAVCRRRRKSAASGDESLDSETKTSFPSWA
jgi:hypothetical protein